MARADITVHVKDIPEVRGYIAQLEDAVVGAAALWFEEIPARLAESLEQR